ncbi:MAG TPA: hemolysin III family protein [Acidimicrobiia bacterium]|nr:hemolysin III family protein [Acidimicrobiia bacterium]
MEAHERMRLGKMTHPVRGFLDASAALVSIVGAIALLTLSHGGTWRRLSLFAFGLSLVAMFTTSSLYHSIPWQGVWKSRMQRLDHTMIHVLVAGTFTPIAVIVLDGWLRWVTLGVQWGIVAFGAIHKTVSKMPRHWVSVALSTTQGWLAVLVIGPLAHRLPWTALLLMGLGGVLYTVGMVFLVTGRPRLWPRVFSYHEAFHVLVIAAAALHFSVIAAWVASYRG